MALRTYLDISGSRQGAQTARGLVLDPDPDPESEPEPEPDSESDEEELEQPHGLGFWQLPHIPDWNPSLSIYPLIPIPTAIPTNRRIPT